MSSEQFMIYKCIYVTLVSFILSLNMCWKWIYFRDECRRLHQRDVKIFYRLYVVNYTCFNFENDIQFSSALQIWGIRMFTASLISITILGYWPAGQTNIIMSSWTCPCHSNQQLGDLKQLHISAASIVFIGSSKFFTTLNDNLVGIPVGHNGVITFLNHKGRKEGHFADALQDDMFWAVLGMRLVEKEMFNTAVYSIRLVHLWIVEYNRLTIVCTRRQTYDLENRNFYSRLL